jgi:hypothetical protein
VSEVDADTVPGYPEAVSALTRLQAEHGLASGAQLDPVDIHMVVSLVMAVSRPHLIAEALADMADDLALMNGGVDTVDSFVLDQTSHDIREYLNVR